MMIHEITEKVGSYPDRKRVGRGRGSGKGKTSGRGHKGDKSRSGYSQAVFREGGQMAWFRRIPKRGFSNADFETVYHVINVGQLNDRFKDGDEVNAQTLHAARLIRDASLPVKILGQGDLTRKLTVTAAKFSASARQKIEAAGGTANEKVKAKWSRAKAAKPAQ